MNYKQKGDGIEGRHCCPSLPPLANEGWDPGWPWDLMLDVGWLERGDMSLLVSAGGWEGGGVLSIRVGSSPFKALAKVHKGNMAFQQHSGCLNISM